LTVGSKSKLSFRDTATSGAASCITKNSSVFNLHLKISIDSEDLTNTDKSFQIDGEAKLNAGCEAFNLSSGFDNKFRDIEHKPRTGV